MDKSLRDIHFLMITFDISFAFASCTYYYNNRNLIQSSHYLLNLKN